MPTPFAKSIAAVIRPAARWQHVLLLGLVLCALGAARSAHADDDSERDELARISYELQRVQQMAAEAAKRAPAGQRVRFRYDWLVRDLEMVRQGVEDHADAPRQPRPVAPLRGDYRH